MLLPWSVPSAFELGGVARDGGVDDAAPFSGRPMISPIRSSAATLQMRCQIRRAGLVERDVSLAPSTVISGPAIDDLRQMTFAVRIRCHR